MIVTNVFLLLQRLKNSEWHIMNKAYSQSLHRNGTFYTKVSFFYARIMCKIVFHGIMQLNMVK